MSSPKPKSLIVQLCGLGLVAMIVSAIIYAGGMSVKVIDRLNGPSVAVSVCANADIMVSIAEGSAGTLLSLNLANNRTVTVQLLPDAEAQLVPNRWKDGNIEGYASLLLEPMEVADSYIVRIPADQTLLLDSVDVRCHAYGTDLMVSLATWTWMPGFDNRVYLIAKL